MPNESATLDEFSKLAKARSKTYGFLSLIYLQAPNKDFLKKIFDPNFRSFLTSLTSEKSFPREMTEGLKIVKDFIEKSRKKSLRELCKELSVEYTRLFRGVKPFYGPPPPYESVYIEGRIMGESTVRVSKEYSRSDVGIPNRYKKEPPDHIGLELDYMCRLTNWESLAWKENRLTEAIRILGDQRKFIREHLITWVPSLCDKVTEEAKIEFYQGIAKITKGFVRFEFDQIGFLIEMAKSVKS